MKMTVTEKRKFAKYLLEKDFFNDEKEVDETYSTILDIIGVLNISVSELIDVAKSLKK